MHSGQAVVNPMFSHTGRAVARPTDGAAGKRMGNQGLLGESERRAVMARIRVQDLPGAKASTNAAFDDFQQVSRYETIRQTVSGEKADGEDENIG